MARDPARTLGLAAAVLLAGVAAVVLLPRFELASGIEVDLITRLKTTERDGLSVPVPGVPVPLVSQRHHFDRITIRVDSSRQTATAVATLDFDGTLGEVKVSSLGLERVPWQLREGAWAPVEGWAPTLARVVGALEARRGALEAGSLTRLAALRGGEDVPPPPGEEAALAGLLHVRQRRYQVRAWYIRAEREEILVTEEYRLTGQLPDRPVDEGGRRHLILRPRGRDFFFWPGIM